MTTHNHKHDREQEIGQRQADRTREKQNKMLSKPTAQHTPVPWEAGVFNKSVQYISIRNADKSEPYAIAHVEGRWRPLQIVQANAAFIVTAVNAHDKLVEACKAALPAIRWSATHQPGNISQCEEVEQQLEQALKKAVEQ